ncbi:hypothetical protein ACN9MF_13175 [Methylobacterium fujisawaense]|uniref:hypothetical protein n=1 Tax=Methylobacterium fujisawaense TaxID=107400 RepID=UPI003CF150FF
MSNIATEIVKTVDLLKQLIGRAGLNTDFYIKFNDYASGQRLYTFLINGRERSIVPTGLSLTIPEYKLISRDEATVGSVKIRWPIQSTFQVAETP